MKFKWSNYLDVAATLLQKYPDNEAALRTAVSRAYYAAFHHAATYLRSQVRTLHLPGRGEDHEAVPRYLREGTRLERGAGFKLERLRTLRRWADYNSSQKPNLIEDVREVLLIANSIVKNLDVPEQT